MNDYQIWKNVSKISIISLVLTFLAEFYIVILENFDKLSDIGSFSAINHALNLFSAKHCILLFAIAFIFSYIWKNEDLRSKIGNFTYKYRYLLALTIFLMCVLFEIHGSSFGMWDEILGGKPHQTLLGVVRPIRSDEWNVLTPLALSQYFSNFAYFSPIPRASLTDMFAVYGTPVWNILIIFRPFQIGYLFLSQAKGLSFFWMGRLIALLLASFEMGMIITRKDKTLSLSYALLLTFSPILQWWFAVNYIAEIFIFGQLAVLAICHYANTRDYRKRFIFSILFAFSVCGYAFALYPAWQIPCGYVFLFLAIWLILDNHEDFFNSKKDLILIALSFLLIAAGIGYFLTQSIDTIEIVKNTVYPGTRQNFGGWLLDGMRKLCDYIVSPLLPLNYDITLIPDNINLCEAARIYDFFPVPLILYFIINFIEKKHDKLLNLLFVLQVFLGIFFVFGFPPFLSKITLLSQATDTRMVLAFNLMNLLMLFRSIALFNETSNKHLSRIRDNNLILILISVLISLLVFLSSNFTRFEFFTLKFFLCLSVFLIGLLSISIFLIFKSGDGKYKNYFLIACIFIALMSGTLVNPIESGISYYDKEASQFAADIVQDDPNATWIMINPIKGNSFLPVGARTINSINTYPDLDRWHKFDKNNQSFDDYNRYAHIFIKLSKDHRTSFALVNADMFNVTLNTNDLKYLNVSYIASDEDISDFSTENVEFDEIYKNEKLRIYSVDYA